MGFQRAETRERRHNSRPRTPRRPRFLFHRDESTLPRRAAPLPCCCRAIAPSFLLLPRVLGCAALRPVPGGVTLRPVPGRAALRASLGRWTLRRPGEQAAYPDRGRALLRLAISKYELHSPCNADGRENFLLF